MSAGNHFLKHGWHLQPATNHTCRIFDYWHVLSSANHVCCIIHNWVLTLWGLWLVLLWMFVWFVLFRYMWAFLSVVRFLLKIDHVLGNHTTLYTQTVALWSSPIHPLFKWYLYISTSLYKACVPDTICPRHRHQKVNFSDRWLRYFFCYEIASNVFIETDLCC